ALFRSGVLPRCEPSLRCRQWKSARLGAACIEPSAPMKRLARPGCAGPRHADDQETDMGIATPDEYVEMIDRAKANSYAYPAVNVTSSQTLNAALRGFAEAERDCIIQVSVGGAEYASG